MKQARGWTIWVCSRCNSVAPDYGQEASCCWYIHTPLERHRVPVFEAVPCEGAREAIVDAVELLRDWLLVMGAPDPQHRLSEVTRRFLGSPPVREWSHREERGRDDLRVVQEGDRARGAVVESREGLPDRGSGGSERLDGDEAGSVDGASLARRAERLGVRNQALYEKDDKEGFWGGIEAADKDRYLAQADAVLARVRFPSEAREGDSRCATCDGELRPNGDCVNGHTDVDG